MHFAWAGHAAGCRSDVEDLRGAAEVDLDGNQIGTTSLPAEAGSDDEEVFAKSAALRRALAMAQEGL